MWVPGVRDKPGSPFCTVCSRPVAMPVRRRTGAGVCHSHTLCKTTRSFFAACSQVPQHTVHGEQACGGEAG